MTAPPRSQPKIVHSKLPWRAARGGYLMAPDEGNHEVQVARIGDFFDKELLPFNRDRWQADLELIVEAVNSRAALKARIEDLEAVLSILREMTNDATIEAAQETLRRQKAREAT